MNLSAPDFSGNEEVKRGVVRARLSNKGGYLFTNL